MKEDLRLGVFICECGGRIEPDLDLMALAGQVNELPGVASVRRLRYGCSPDGLEAIQSAIAANDLDLVLVAACTPRTMQPRLRAACAQGGIDGDHFKLVDIREGCAWAHPNEVKAATLKAADLIRMGTAELRLRRPHRPVTGEVSASALVVGGSIAGATAAQILAEEGIPVTLIEREPSLPQDTANCEDLRAVLEHPRIDVLLGKTITSISGRLGRYSVTASDGGSRMSGVQDFEVGAIVIATDAMQDVDALAYTLGIPQDLDGHLPSTRIRLRPGNFVNRGIYVCGAAHRPTDERQAEFQGAYAALSALNHLTSGKQTNKAPAAVVDQRLCTGCATCVTACPLAAISMRRGPGVLDVSEIDPMLCSACGNCAVACPSNAIELPWSSDAALFAQIDAALQSRSANGAPRVLVFGCEWSGQIAAELAGARRLGYPTAIRPITVECSARIDPTFALWAFHQGAEGVLLTACRPGKCHFAGANLYAQRRIETLRGQLAETGFDVRRLQLEWVQPDDPEAYVDKVSRFSGMMTQLSPRRAAEA